MSTTIGILGGGISGLSAAYHLARRLPASSATKIVLLEKSKRLGGWIQSENTTVETTSSSGSHVHSVVLEAGPRTLRPKSLDMLELVSIFPVTWNNSSHVCPRFICWVLNPRFC